MSAFSLLSIWPLRAQQPNQPAPARSAAEANTIKQVRGALYQVSGGVGNAFFYVAPEETLVIDAKMTSEAAGQMLAEIKKITDKPVRRLLLTHSDGDHVGGLVAFPPNLTIISQANTKQLMEQANATAAVKLPLPTETFTKEKTLALGDKEIQLLYFGPAHTSGDAVIYFASEKAAVVGDLLFFGRDPLIHLQKQGSSFGLVTVLKEILKLDADLYLSGHSDAVDKKAVETLLAQIEEKQAKVKALVQEGKSLDDVKKAFNMSDQPAAAGARRWPSLVEIIYRELTEKK
ncbi:MAG: MBL fold metallo-hydrolase [Candidatus Sumerlaeota bacterium]|nr:MBL fold metallo-hydrolase [Candidatus Sumerlaeota bacterium]